MAKAKLGGIGGGMNMQAMIKHAQKMQQEMLRAQEEMAQTETEATAGGGAVKAVVLGTTSLKSLEIKPEVVDPEDIEMLQDLVMAAINEALRKAQEQSENNMRAITGGMSGGIPGVL